MTARFVKGGSVAVVLLVAFAGYEQSNYAAPAPSAARPPVLGVFEGRTPCGKVAAEFTGFPAQNCEKIKWRLILYHHPESSRPSTYRFDGTRTRREGTWSIIRGTATDPQAIVYRLKYEAGAKSVAFLKADDNILLLLDRNLRLMVGDASWSYTLSRTDRMPNN